MADAAVDLPWHIDPASTHWCQCVAPELLVLAGGRFDQHLAGWL